MTLTKTKLDEDVKSMDVSKVERSGALAVRRVEVVCLQTILGELRADVTTQTTVEKSEVYLLMRTEEIIRDREA